MLTSRTGSIILIQNIQIQCFIQTKKKSCKYCPKIIYICDLGWKIKPIYDDDDNNNNSNSNSMPPVSDLRNI